MNLNLVYVPKGIHPKKIYISNGEIEVSEKRSSGHRHGGKDSKIVKKIPYIIANDDKSIVLEDCSNNIRIVAEICAKTNFGLIEPDDDYTQGVIDDAIKKLNLKVEGAEEVKEPTKLEKAIADQGKDPNEWNGNTINAVAKELKIADNLEKKDKIEKIVEKIG